jgi:hypothetical protein
MNGDPAVVGNNQPASGPSSPLVAQAAPAEGSSSADASDARKPGDLLCPRCSRPFRPRKGWQKFCSERCRKAYHGAGREQVQVLRKALEQAREVIDRALRQTGGVGGQSGG